MKNGRFGWLGATSLVLVAVFGLAGLTIALAQDQAEPGKEDKKPKPQYVGVSKCKLCHTRKSQGAQYKVWDKGPHAKAYETLGTDKAKEVGAGLGVTDPQNDPKCLKCHVAGYGLPKEHFASSYKLTDGVSCEACHGPASLWYADDLHSTDVKKAEELGLLHPDEKTCKKCHNEESPTYKEFDYKKRFEEIKHPRPKKEEDEG